MATEKTERQEDKSGPPHRKVYAKGFYDGIKAAAFGITTLGEGMNHARKVSLISGLSGIAKKVFDAVPLGEEWSAGQIGSEVHRTGTAIDMKTLQGCLGSLVNQKLIKETSPGSFTRRERAVIQIVKTEPEYFTKPKEAPVLTVTAEKNNQPKDKAAPIDVIGDIAKNMALVISQVNMAITNLNKLKGDIEEAAIIIEEQFAESEKRSEKLKQLQELLKNLG